MTEELTVVCSVWHKQKNLDLYFEQHSQSLLGQSIPIKIIYICDGGLSLPKIDEKITIVSVSAPIKTAQAFNTGLVLTDTPYFCVLNMDDFFFQNGLEIQLGAIKQLEADAFYGDWEIRFTENGDFRRLAFELHELQPCEQWPPELKPGQRLGNGDGLRGTWGPAPIYKTSAIRSVGGYPSYFGDGTSIPTIIDFVVWDRMLKNGKKVSRGEIVVGSYYSNPQTQQEFRTGPDGVGNEHKHYERYGALI